MAAGEPLYSDSKATESLELTGGLAREENGVKLWIPIPKTMKLETRVQ